MPENTYGRKEPMRSPSQADWRVHIDKEDFYLTSQEYELMKQAANAGRTMVWFEDFSFSIPHIAYTERIAKRAMPKTPELPEATVTDLHEKIIETKKKYLLV